MLLPVFSGSECAAAACAPSSQFADAHVFVVDGQRAHWRSRGSCGSKMFAALPDSVGAPVPRAPLHLSGQPLSCPVRKGRLLCARRRLRWLSLLDSILEFSPFAMTSSNSVRVIMTRIPNLHWCHPNCALWPPTDHSTCSQTGLEPMEAMCLRVTHA